MSTFVTTDIPARAAIAQLMAGKQIAFSLSGVARLGVADHMSEHPVAVEDLARKVDAQPDALFRVMRLLASVGVFDQFPGRKFALTPVGKHLQTDVLGSVRYLAAFSGDEWAVRAYEQFLHCLRTGEDGVSKAYGKHAFDLLAERPDQAENFHQAMTANSGLQARAILDAYDFSGIKRIADVGGGHALLLASILEAYPETTGVLHDLPEVVAGVPPERISKCGGMLEIVDQKKRTTRQNIEEHFDVVHAERMPLGTLYPDVVAHVRDVLSRPPLCDGCYLVIDESGVGRAVGDMFTAAGLRAVRVAITAGTDATKQDRLRWSVAKSLLISGVDARLHSGELRFAADLGEAHALAEELKDFRRHVGAAGRATYQARIGKHDDLVLAVAIALWWATERRKYRTLVNPLKGLY
jgi:O-methyltransferase